MIGFDWNAKKESQNELAVNQTLQQRLQRHASEILLQLPGD